MCSNHLNLASLTLFLQCASSKSYPSLSFSKKINSATSSSASFLLGLSPSHEDRLVSLPSYKPFPLLFLLHFFSPLPPLLWSVEPLLLDHHSLHPKKDSAYKDIGIVFCWYFSPPQPPSHMTLWICCKTTSALLILGSF